ncbi:MAG TPA: DUF1259 domain-containing protein [Gemmatimonadales bacterium]|nr:DUF1259 domain-containing protein [Gemmatimonadales bacterium]
MRNRSRTHAGVPLAHAGVCIALCLVTPAGRLAAQAAGTDTSWAAVDRAMGRAGAAQPGGVHKYSLPRSDLRVSVGGIAVKPALALGSWVAFERMGAGGDSAMAMGDLVLLEREVTPVLSKLQQMGVQQTALHNHLQGESPRLMYLHVEAEGAPARVAGALRAALALTGTPPATPAAGAGGASAPGLDTAAIARALGRSGKTNGGVYQVSVPRAEAVRVHGLEIPPAMGVATAINFQPTGGGRAAITGDFVLTGPEVNPVIRTLRAHGIAVTALHSHLLDEEPEHLYFMHFWAVDDAVRLAEGLRAALAQMKVPQAAS